MTEDQWNDVCRSAFEKIERKIDRIDEAVRGNGKPGLNQRVADLEAMERRRSRLMWIVIAAVVVSSVNLAVSLI
jgi:hypothetical protein